MNLSNNESRIKNPLLPRAKHNHFDYISSSSFIITVWKTPTVNDQNEPEIHKLSKKAMPIVVRRPN